MHLARGNAAHQYGGDFDGEATVIVGDTPLDVAAALATGARAVGVATGGFSGPELAASGAHAVLPDLSAIDQVLAAIPRPAGVVATALYPLPPTLRPGCPHHGHRSRRYPPPGQESAPASARTASLSVMPTHLPDDCARLLDFQHGMIARWQAPAVGLSLSAIDAQLRRGRWQPLYRGVYAAYTGAPPRESVLWAGVLRGGPGAVLSHHTAAELDGLTDRPGRVIDVTVGHDRRISLSGEERRGPAPRIAFHRTRRIDAIRHPAKTPPRTRVEETILDLIQCSSTFDDVLSWLCKGCGRRVVTPQLIHTAAGMRGRVRWRDDILGALPLIAEGAHSPLEYRYVRDVETAHGLPKARRQARRISGKSRLPRPRYLDSLYEAFGVVVELDGRADHLAEDRWRDIRRDNANARSGIMTLRYNWADVTRRPCDVAADVADALRICGWEGLPRCCGPSCSTHSSMGNRVSRID